MSAYVREVLLYLGVTAAIGAAFILVRIAFAKTRLSPPAAIVSIVLTGAAIVLILISGPGWPLFVILGTMAGLWWRAVEAR